MTYKIDYIKTVPELFQEAMAQDPSRIIFQYKVDGEWKPTSYGEAYDLIERIGFGLRNLDVKEGDKVGILSENRPEWSIVDWACSNFGNVSVPVYQTSIPSQVEYILNHAECKIVFVSSQEQADKVLSIKKKLKHLKYMVIIEPHTSTEDWIFSFEDILSKGEIERGFSKISMKGLSDNVRPDDLWSIIYTSGTSGNPKGVMISQFNMAANVQQTKAHVPFTPNEHWLSFLPLSHSFERLTSLFTFWIGGEIYFAESIAKVVDNMKEVKPKYLTTVPRLLEKVYAAVIDQMSNESQSKQSVFNWALGIGHETVEKFIRFDKKPRGILGRKYALAKSLVYNKISDIFGGEFEICICGGAPLSPEIGEFFACAGIIVIEGYGLTEMSPITHGNLKHNLKFGKVGAAYMDVQTRILEDGEIVLKGPNMMMGYYKGQEETAEAIDKEGWFHTGDIGFVDEDGYLKITDRKKNLIVTAGGKNIAPAAVERQLTSSKYVEQAVVIGDRRKFLTAILVPSVEIFTKWGENQKKRINFKSYSEIISNQDVLDLIKSELAESQKELARFEQIKYFFIPPQPFTIEGGELTASMKIKRNEVIARYEKEIDALYE